MSRDLWYRDRRMPMEVLVAHRSDVGRVRKANEDSFLCRADPQRERGHLLVLADGMGGAAAGELASRIAVEAVCNGYFASSAPAEQALAEALIEAGARILERSVAEPGTQGMGTTCTALAIRDGAFWVASVGDSRAYLVRDGGIERLTDDHSLWAERARSGKVGWTPSAQMGRNELLCALGLEREVKPEIVGAREARPGDRFLLCTDGLWGLVTDPEILAIVHALPPEDACERLVALANERGGHDNITALICEVRG